MSHIQKNLDFLHYEASKNSLGWQILTGLLTVSRKIKRIFQFNRGKMQMVENQAAENLVPDFSVHKYDELLPASWLPYPELRRIWFTEDQNPTGRKVVLVSSDAFIPGQGYGGYTTSLLLAGFIASKEKASLEVWNLSHDSSVSKIRSFIKENLQIDFHAIAMKNVNNERLSFGPNDIFLATSWWAKSSLLESGIDPFSIVYLVQEDETMFYPSSDKSLEATRELITSKHIIYNTNLLKEHLENNHPLLKTINSSVFEPPFMQVKSRTASPVYGDKKRLVFYARPNHPRNLFVLGVQVIESLVATLDSTKWEIIFLGTGLPDSLTIGSHWEATVLQDIPYAQYTSLLNNTDVILSLMLAPHPSYPPLEAAMAGAWVVTNSYQSRTDLKEYNDQIVVTTPELSALRDAIQSCIDKAEEDIYPSAPTYSIMHKSWNESFECLKNFTIKKQ